MRTRLFALVLLAGVVVIPPVHADPCDSPWALDYRYQPGASEFSAQGRTLDIDFFRPGQTVVLLGEDDVGHWLRTYQIQPPAMVNLVDERRDFVNPTAVEVRGAHAFVLDANGLHVLVLGGAGKMYSVESLPLGGEPILLAIDGDRAWAGGGALISEIDITDPESPVVLRSVSTPSVGPDYATPRLRVHEQEAWVIGLDNDILYVDGRGSDLVAQSLGVAPFTREEIVDVGWLDSGARIIAWQVSDGNLGSAGTVQICSPVDLFLRAPFSDTTESQCGSSIPTVGSDPRPVCLFDDPRGLMYSGSGGGTYSGFQPAWRMYTGASGLQPALADDLWQFIYEIGWLGEILIGRTDAGFIIEAPDGSASSPLLSTTRYVGANDDTHLIAQNGRIVAITVGAGIQLVDASDPTAPGVAALIPTTGMSWLELVEGDPTLYGRRGNDIIAWDVSDPSSPAEIGVHSIDPGSARVALYEGSTALFLSSDGSTTITARVPPGRPSELLRAWELTKPLYIGAIAGNLIGGRQAWIRMDWTEPIVPRSVWADEADGSWPWAYYFGRSAYWYSASAAVIRGVYSVDLNSSPASRISQRHSRFSQSFTYFPDAHGDALWVAQEEGVTVGWASGEAAGSIDAFVTEFGTYFGFYWQDGIAVGSEFVAIATQADLFLLAPNCRGPALPVTVVVREFDVTPDHDGCAVIQFETAQEHELDLVRVSAEESTVLPVSVDEAGVSVSRDCPSGPVVYQLRDASGYVYAREEFSPVPEARRHSALVSVRPNPFNPRTVIEYTNAESGEINLAVYDNRGRQIRILVSKWAEAGRATEIWDGTDDAGSRVAAGVYFVSLRTSRGRDVTKIALVK